MTDSNPTTFRSAGTLQADLCADDNPLRKILFAPDTDHTVHHRLKTLAVFVPTDSSGAARVIPVDHATPIELSVSAPPNSAFVRSVVHVAIRQCCVDVEVVFCDSDHAALQALTVPAVPHRK
ncbi:MAG: hypothetical protein OXU21_01735 [Chloroflexota bacterium]|nr:hypothetical protein [Chloroflexota bacterium]